MIGLAVVGAFVFMYLMARANTNTSHRSNEIPLSEDAVFDSLDEDDLFEDGILEDELLENSLLDEEILAELEDVEEIPESTGKRKTRKSLEDYGLRSRGDMKNH